MNVERNIPLISITGVSLSNLRDDWVILHVNNPTKELGDPVFSCLFKTELLVHLLQRTGSSVQVKIASQIDYCKKLNKTATLKFTKDESIKKNDVYKSHTISVCSGEPANSVSDPPCPKKEPPPRPITSGKLLKAGGPTKSKATTPKSAAKITPPTTTPNTTVTKRTSIGGRGVPPPPPPPAPQRPPSPPPPPTNPTFKGIYDFVTEDTGELPFKSGDILEILQKDDNGWWLAKKDGQQGWVPSNYLEEIKVAPKTNPALPARRKPPPAPQEKKKEPPQEFAAEEEAEEKEPAKKSSFRNSIANKSYKDDSSNSSAPVPVFPGMAPVNSASGVPPWKAALEAKKAAARASETTTSTEDTENERPVAPSRKTTGPAKKAPPPVVSKPIIPPKKPSTGDKPPAPPKPGTSGSKPLAPPRPSGQMSLADALKRRNQRLNNNDDEDEDDDEWN